MSIVEIMLLFVATILVGVIVGYIIRDNKKQVTDGILKCQRDPDDGLYLFVEFKKDTDPMNLLNKKYAIFTVDPNDIVSHD